MTSRTVESSRTVPVGRQRAFDATLPMPLPLVFSRRHLLLPPVKEVRGQSGVWGEPGQSRIVVTGDGGTMREQLTGVDSPTSFSYRLSDITGPMRLLVDSIDGRWEFAAAGAQTVITWRWTLHARGVGASALPLITAMWKGYAAKALETLSTSLVEAPAA